MKKAGVVSGWASEIAPHVAAVATLRRRGGFFLPGDWQEEAGRAVGAAWVQWEAPALAEDWRAPVVLVHGGGGQSTDWMWARDDQPGWAELFVRSGHPTYLFDRPGHGRSIWDAELMGARGPVPTVRQLVGLFGFDYDSLMADLPAALTAVLASSCGLLGDPALAQNLDRRRLSDLLDIIGPAIIVSHSAGAPGVWLAAAHAPERVLAVVAIEPLGPPHADGRHRQALASGLTAHPLMRRSDVDPSESGLRDLRILVVTAEGSGHLEADSQTAAFLANLGARVDHLRLQDVGLEGDGHGVIFDRHSTAAFRAVYRRLNALTGSA